MSGLALFIAVFLACAVEAVEATTIVLAAGTARDWKSALLGTGGGLGVLIVIIGVFGNSISALPINSLRLFVGGLLLVFGLQWIRKAILRASGYKSLHDEDLIFQEELAAAKAAKAGKRFGVADWYAFTLSFKGVLLEGLEVAFIVLTFGTIQHQVGLASVAALAAVLLVAVGGFTLRKPLARVPENTMKFIVGILLTSFGIFWGSEGAGATWPHSDLSLLGIIPGVVLVCFALVALLKSRKAQGKPVCALNLPTFREPSKDSSRLVRLGGGFLFFWYDFIIGDDWRLAAGVVLGFYAIHALGVSAWWIMPVVVAAMLSYTLHEATRPVKTKA